MSVFPDQTPPPTHWAWRSGGVAAVVFSLVIAVFFFEHLFLGYSLVPLDLLNQLLLPHDAGQTVRIQNHYPIDELTQLVPNAQFWRDSIRAGEWPLWNPYILGGNPHQASGIWGVLSPFKLFLLLPITIDRAYTLGLIFQFWCAGLLMAAYLREQGRSVVACFLAACAWSLCSNLLYFHWLYLNVFVWAPLFMLAWERSLRSGKVEWLLGCAIVLALACVGGSIQFTAFAIFLWGWHALGSFQWKQPEQRRRGIRSIGTVTLLTLGFTAPQWFPLIEFFGLETQRFQNLEPGVFGWKHSLLGPVAMLFSFFFPALAGTPPGYDLLKSFGGNLIDFNGAIGVIPWLLAIIGLRWGSVPRKRVWIAMVLVIGSLVFFTPLQRFLYHRFLILVVLSAVVFSAAGWDALQTQRGNDWYKSIGRTVRFGALLGVLLILGFGIGRWWIQKNREAVIRRIENRVLGEAEKNQFGVFPEWLKGRVRVFVDHYRPTNHEFWMPAAILVIAELSRRRWKHRPTPTMNPSFDRALLHSWPGWLLALSVLDLSITLRDRVVRADPQKHPFYPATSVTAPLVSDQQLFRCHRWMPQESMLFRDNILWQYRVESVSGYDSMSPDGLRQLNLDLSGLSEASLERLGLVNAKYVLTDRTQQFPAHQFTLIAEDRQARLWSNHVFRERIYFDSQWVKEPTSDAALKRINAPEYTMNQPSFVDRDPGFSASTERRTAVVRKIQRLSPRRVTAEVETEVPGIAVFSETWYPGWKAKVDQERNDVLRVNGVMMGTIVPPGRHQIEFIFEPARFRVGWLLAGMTLVGSLIGRRWNWMETRL